MVSFSLKALIGEVAHSVLWLAILAAIFSTLERIWSLHSAKFARKDIGLDIFLFFVSSLGPAMVMATPIAWLLAATRYALPASLQTWSLLLPLPARYAITMLVAELGSYWGHRWAHKSRWLWKFHALHHSANHMDWLVNTRAHPVDMVFMRLCALAPLSLLGLANSTGGSQISIVATLVAMFWGFLIHSNVRLRLGPLEQWLASPFFHHWHHSKVEPINRNYAATLPMFDRFFGTLHLPSKWPLAYGIAEQLPTDLNKPATEIATPRALLSDYRD